MLIRLTSDTQAKWDIFQNKKSEAGKERLRQNNLEEDILKQESDLAKELQQQYLHVKKENHSGFVKSDRKCQELQEKIRYSKLVLEKVRNLGISVDPKYLSDYTTALVKQVDEELKNRLKAYSVQAPAQAENLREIKALTKIRRIYGTGTGTLDNELLMEARLPKFNKLWDVVLGWPAFLHHKNHAGNFYYYGPEDLECEPVTDERWVKAHLPADKPVKKKGCDRDDSKAAASEKSAESVKEGAAS